ncbi:Uncharacterised protein [Chlamydia trachomatis]|nr:Uncharacterised protein [Chlamydia trachomatis]
MAPPAMRRVSQSDGLPAKTCTIPIIATAMMQSPNAARRRTEGGVCTFSMSAIARPTSTTGRINAPAPITQWHACAIAWPTGPATSIHTDAPMTAARPMSTRPHASACRENTVVVSSVSCWLLSYIVLRPSCISL